jgi:hypothetical protein
VHIAISVELLLVALRAFGRRCFKNGWNALSLWMARFMLCLAKQSGKAMQAFGRAKRIELEK